jgi:acyl-CoA dehydrogenase
MGKDFDAEIHRQQSMILVPLDTPGVKVVRNISVMHHHSHESHCEIVFENVRVPAATCWAGRAMALPWRRRGWGRGASTIACARSGRPNWR